MKKRDRRTKQDVKGLKGDKKGVKEASRSSKQDVRGSKRQVNSGASGTASVRARTKRSGVEAVKLHIEVTGSTGRTSRSATSVSFFFSHKILNKNTNVTYRFQNIIALFNVVIKVKLNYF